MLGAVIGGGGGSSTPPTTPVAGYYGWWRGTDVLESGGAVSQITDKSGNGNHFTQGTAGAKPTLASASIYIGGQDGVSFDGTSDFMDNSATQETIFGTGDFSAWFVGAYMSLAGTAGAALTNFAASSLLVLLDGSGTSTIYAQSASAPLVFSRQGFFMIEAYNVSTNVTVRNLVGTSTQAVDRSGNTGIVQLGAFGASPGSSPCEYIFAELLVYKLALGADDRLLNRQYIMNRYMASILSAT